MAEEERSASERQTWTAEKQAEFLAELACTCNVARSADAVGMSERGAYRARARLPAFREAWAEALRAGYQALELRLVERALADMGEEDRTAASDKTNEAGSGTGRSKPAQGRNRDAEGHAMRLLSAHREGATAPIAAAAKLKTKGRSPRERIEAALRRHEGKSDG